MSTVREVVLEPAEQEFADASANPSYLFQLGPEEGNKVVDETATSLNTDCDKRDADLRGPAFSTLPGSPRSASTPMACNRARNTRARRFPRLNGRPSGRLRNEAHPDRRDRRLQSPRRHDRDRR
jgi:hypothetical protein